MKRAARLLGGLPPGRISIVSMGRRGSKGRSTMGNPESSRAGIGSTMASPSPSATRPGPSGFDFSVAETDDGISESGGFQAVRGDDGGGFVLAR